MTIDHKTLTDEILATPQGVARAIKLKDEHGNDFGHITWVWDNDCLSVTSQKLPNGYEGLVLGVEDMVGIHLESSGAAPAEAQAKDLALQLMLWGACVVPSPNEGGAPKPAIGPISLDVDTACGKALAHVSCNGGFIQIDVLNACAQPPFFVVLADSLAAEVLPTIQKLVEGAPLPCSAKITERVEDAVDAGTGEHAQQSEPGAQSVQHDFSQAH